MEKKVLKEQSNPDIPKLQKAITLGCLPVKNAEVISSKQPLSKLWNTPEGRVGFKFINKNDRTIYYYADMTWVAPQTNSKPMAKGTWTCDELTKDPNEIGVASSVPMSPSDILLKY
jgi:hypothetical protein